MEESQKESAFNVQNQNLDVSQKQEIQQTNKKVNFMLQQNESPPTSHTENKQQQEIIQFKKPQQAIYNSMKRKTYSKYDLVKVRVILQDHFYIFSRFLISRVLTLIKVKEKDSIRMTLEVKKMLIESNRLEISQAELESYLFEVLKKFGYNDEFVKQYKMITAFYQKRLPFIIMIVGTDCMGKSTLVTQLGERINVSNIVQTSIVQKVMMGLSQLMQANQKAKIGLEDENVDQLTDEDIINNYQGLQGSHLDPNLYLRKGIADDGSQKLEIFTPNPEDEEESMIENDSIKKMRKQMQEINQSGAMIIPFLLTISPESHGLCLESKITQEFSQKPHKDLPINVKQYVKSQIRKYQTIQNYLIKECEKFGFKILEININYFEETIEKMHDHINICQI
ncbi:UNKNOWN [Stylonychia lemnae]|uniref:Uncharacterized protein n=1 Tax=Stylonychia lemnae TaxID=5949 RepID=A0A078A4Z1_STYLE|nr:UNKNOWN [Stylonychia lemnae]|eukprot:CDW77269.1 UNKNOWN [Stylonychia lemnae]